MANSINVDEAGLIILSEIDKTLDSMAGESYQTVEFSGHKKKLNQIPFVGGDFPDAAYYRIAEILKEQQNFHLEAYKVLCIKRRLAARIRAVGYNDPESYIELLQESGREQEQLLAALSIHVSQFFRNHSVFNALEKRVLPELLDVSRGNKSKLRIWSVGCANGEEPYSLALLCQKLLRKGDLLSIIGTDLSPEALKRAKRGCFPVDRVRAVSSEMLLGFFSRKGQMYQLNDQIREFVQFFRHDILTEQPFYRADLILCRNLLIYFSREQQQRILEILAAALLPGGYLVLGRAETLAPACHELFICIDPAERIYRRAATHKSLL